MSIVRRWVAILAHQFPAPSGWPRYPRFSDHAEVRLLIGPGNYSGQATAWARAVAASNAPTVDAKSMRVGDKKFRFTADILETRDYLRSALGQWRQRRWVMQSATHILVEAGLPILSISGPASAEWRQLQQAGLSVALVAHGSDVRIPSQHAERYPESPFRNVPPEWRDWVAQRERVTVANVTAMMGSGLPIFVSTPDLLDFLPQAHLLPAAVDVGAEAHAETVGRTRPRVLFLPTNGWLKGAAAIVPVLQELQQEGAIEFIDPSRSAAAKFDELIQSADIVVDAIGLGAHGVTSVEAMALGKITMVHIAEHVMMRYPERPPLIVIESAARFREMLVDVVHQIDEYKSQAARGPDYVRRWHDGRASAEVLMRHWLGVRR